MDNKQLLERLKKEKACTEAIEWANGMDLKTAWNTCERADWMLWYMCRTDMATERERIHVICDCAATALKYVPKGEDRPRLAIEATRRYADNPTEKNKVAKATAWAAARAAARAAAWTAPWTAAGAAAHKNMCNIIREKIKVGDL